MPAAAGCATLTVVTLNTSTCKRDLGLSKKEPENVTLKTGALGTSAVIVAVANDIDIGEITCPCAGLERDQPAPISVITKPDGAYAAGIVITFGVSVMLTVVVDSIALLVSDTTGWPSSITIRGKMATKDPALLLKMTSWAGPSTANRMSLTALCGSRGVATDGTVIDTRVQFATPRRDRSNKGVALLLFAILAVPCARTLAGETTTTTDALNGVAKPAP